MKRLRTILPAVLFAALALYVVLFYATRLPSVEHVTGNTFRRADFFTYLLRPEDLLETWFGNPPEFALLDRLPVLLVAGVVLGFATVLGWLAMTLCRADRGLTRLETLIFAAAVGLNVVSTYTLLAGLLGGLSKLTFAVPGLAVVAAAGCVWRSERWADRRSSSASRVVRKGTVPFSSDENWDSPRPSPLSARWLWLALPFVVVILLGGMLPPVDFDVREYHLQAPKEFFQQGKITFLPHNVYGNMPMGSEMLSLLSMVIAGDWWLGALAGKTLVALTAPLTALGLFAAGRRFLGTTAGVVAALVYISVPWIVRVSINGLVDGAVAYYAWSAIYSLMLWRGSGSRSHLLLSGYVAGGAVACKYPAVLFVAIPLVLWVFAAAQFQSPAVSARTQSPAVSAGSSGQDARAPRRRRLLACKPVALYLGAVAVGCGLWFGKNWMLTGNPTYPLLYGVFGGKTWTAEKDRQWSRVHRPADFSIGALGHDLYQVGLGSEWLSPLLVPLAALVLLRTGEEIRGGLSPFSSDENGTVPFPRATVRLALGLLAYFAWVIAAWWLCTHRIDRFWLSALPAVAVLGGLGACWSPHRGWRTALALLLPAGLAANLLVASCVCGYSAFFVPLERLRGDPERVNAWHRYFNERFRAGQLDGRVLLVGDAQPFDLEMPVVYSTCFDDCPLEELVKGRSPQQIRAGLAARGVSAVYVHWGEIARYRATYGFSDFVQPEVLDRLVEQGILVPLPAIGGHPGRGYTISLLSVYR